MFGGRIMSALCTVCSKGENLIEFSNPRELSDHIKSGHRTRPEGWKPRQKRITLAEAQTKPSLLASKGASNAPVEVKETPNGSVIEFAGQPPLIVTSPLPIELHYKYSGQCPECRGEIDTITINVGLKDSLVAYCSACKKQYQETKVVPIEKQK